MSRSCPRIILGAERGGAGKTTLSLGLLGAWRRRGRACAAFKKGPDYIDSAWLAVASGRPCRNLDTYLMGEEIVARSFRDRALTTGVNLIEGNRGLYDGVDAEGNYSTAELAKLLDCPIVAIIDCTKQTRTAAAVALGLQMLDPEAHVAGVILNRLGTARQERVIRAAVESDAGVKVLGAVPKLVESHFYERHLGLIPPQESRDAEEAIAAAASIAEKYLDVEALWQVAQQASPLELRIEGRETAQAAARGTVRIGFFRDEAFHFYYPENLEALEALGATLTPIDALRDAALPEGLGALYIGGGFPEECAAALSANRALRATVKEAAEKGLPIYAECGGLMYLGRRLETRKGVFPMAGVFPVSFAVEASPQGHGYVETETLEGHPFLPAGTRMKGHEFHYSRPSTWDEKGVRFALAMKRGHGFSDGRDGLVYKNTFATYVHTHALGEPAWAASVFDLALKFSSAALDAVGVGSGENGRPKAGLPGIKS